METIRTFSAPLPMMPGVWPSKSNKRKSTVRMPQKVQEPVRIGHYLEPLIGIASRADRSEVLRAFFATAK